MKKISNLFYIVFLLFTIILSAQKKEVIGYFPEWGVNYKPYYVNDILTSGAAEHLTIITYAFGIPTPISEGKVGISFESPEYPYSLVIDSENSVDGIADELDQPLRGHFNQLKKLKRIYPDLKVLVSLGGWLGSINFSEAALTSDSREFFVNETIELFIKGNLPILNGSGGNGVGGGIFDGIDIDWEFPVSGGAEGITHNKKDKENLTKLFKLFRNRLDEINPDLLLTAALPAPPANLDNFNVKEDAKYLDWFMLMTYDFYGGWTPLTGHHSNLLQSESEPSGGRSLSMHNTVMKLINDYEVPREKIIPGAAFYGRGWRNVSSKNYGLFENGSIASGIYEGGHNYYSDLDRLTDSSFESYWDDSALAGWLYDKSNEIFWSIDDPQSIVLKSQYVDAYNLRGIMFWDLSGDDENGTLIKSISSQKMPENLRVMNNYDFKGVSLNISKPSKDQNFGIGNNVVITTDVLQSNSLKSVEFFVDDIRIGEDTSFPYSWAIFNIEKGNHCLKVQTNIEGKIVESPDVNIYVK